MRIPGLELYLNFEDGEIIFHGKLRDFGAFSKFLLEVLK